MEYCENYQNVTLRHEVSKCCCQNVAYRLAPCRLATSLQFVKKQTNKQKTVSATYNKVQQKYQYYYWVVCLPCMVSVFISCIWGLCCWDRGFCPNLPRVRELFRNHNKKDVKGHVKWRLPLLLGGLAHIHEAPGLCAQYTRSPQADTKVRQRTQGSEGPAGQDPRTRIPGWGRDLVTTNLQPWAAQGLLGPTLCFLFKGSCDVPPWKVEFEITLILMNVHSFLISSF